MIGRTPAVTVAGLLSTQVNAQANQNGAGPAQGVVSGLAAGSPTSMRPPQAGRSRRSTSEKHGEQSQSVRNKTHQASGKTNDETGATRVQLGALRSGPEVGKSGDQSR